MKTVVDAILYDLKVSVLQYTAKSSRAISSVNVELAPDVSENVCLDHRLMMKTQTVSQMSDTKTQYYTAECACRLHCIARKTTNFQHNTSTITQAMLQVFRINIKWQFQHNQKQERVKSKFVQIYMQDYVLNKGTL